MTNKATVFLCDLTHTGQGIAASTFPLGIGFIASYALRDLSDKVDISLFKFPETLAEKVIARPPHLIGFSNYMWNIDLSYTMARKIKERFPETVVVFGGPNYPTEAAEQLDFLEAHPLIDFYVDKEGERAFTELLRRLLDSGFDVSAVRRTKPPSCHFLHEGDLVAGPLCERIRDLSEIPSPYTMGLFDEFFDGRFAPMIQTNRGCPFTCTFCVEGLSYHNKINNASVEHVSADLHYIARRVKRTQLLRIVDSNFGMYVRDLDICRAIAEVQSVYGWPDYIHVATGKNQKERVIKASEIVGGALRLGAAVQSLDETVLRNVKRKNISAEAIMEVAHKANAGGNNTYSEIILCLPGDTKEAHLNTIKTVIDAGLNFVKLYNSIMLPGTEMASRAIRDEFGLVTKFRVMSQCIGSYDFDGEAFHSVEIEEICVANNTMPFGDFQDCREVDLSVEAFYNDAIFAELLVLLERFKISAFDWLIYIHNQRHRFPELSRSYAEFRRETRDALWDDAMRLERWAKTREVIGKFVSGEYGRNVIYKYKIHLAYEQMPLLHEIVYQCTKELLEARGVREPWLVPYLEDLRVFSELRKRNLLDSRRTEQHTFFFDFVALAGRNFQGDPAEYWTPDGVEIVFEHDARQADKLEHLVAEYGETPTALARILTAVNVTKVHRRVNYQDKAVQRSSDAKDDDR